MTVDLSTLHRFMRAVDVQDVCWVWTGGIDRTGYGSFRLDGKSRRAHRVSYEMFVAPIPDGLVIDHLCRNRACVRPEHLEPVTQQENSRRGVRGEQVRSHWQSRTHCSHGHPLTPDNVLLEPVPGKTWTKRLCRACIRAKTRERRARKGIPALQRGSKPSDRPRRIKLSAPQAFLLREVAAAGTLHVARYGRYGVSIRALEARGFVSLTERDDSEAAFDAWTLTDSGERHLGATIYEGEG